MMMKSHVVLVDENDKEVGTMEKMEAHLNGVLHRAFSVIIFNDKGEMLLQQRALDKYHSGGLWTNACCSHPYPGEDIKTAGERRLNEEMGIKTKLDSVGSFTYHCKFSNGLTEHEFDHVLKGIYNDDPIINPEEVETFKWMSIDLLKSNIILNPEQYTFWFLELVKQDFLILA